MITAHILSFVFVFCLRKVGVCFPKHPVSSLQGLVRIHKKALFWTPVPQLPGPGADAVGVEQGLIRLYCMVLEGGASSSWSNLLTTSVCPSKGPSAGGLIP